MLIRKPHVAGSFYPSEPAELRQFCDRYLSSDSSARPVKARAVILPHAGYVYSGQTACSVLSQIKVPETVLLLGPNHWSVGSPFALFAQGEWETPLGKVPIDSRLAAAIIETSHAMKVDEQAHAREHSLEVLLPFLQTRNPQVKMVPLVVNTFDLEKAADAAEELGDVLSQRKDVLVAISNDMSHYESDEIIRRKDRYALDAILALDEEALMKAAQKYKITMCGLIPVYMLLVMKEALGIKKAELVKYTTSAEASGDTSKAVGYAGFIFK